MRKNKLKLVFLGLLLGGFLIPLSPRLESQKISVNLGIPNESLFLEDLDYRDELNRPISSESRKQILRNLFTNNLNELILKNLTPTKMAIQFVLTQKWDEFGKWWQRIYQNSGFQFVAIVLKKWDLNFVSWTAHLTFRPAISSHVLTSGQCNFHERLSSILSSTVLRR